MSGNGNIAACAFDLGNTLMNDVALTQASLAEMGNLLAGRGLVAFPEHFTESYLKHYTQPMPAFTSRTFGEVQFFRDTFRELGIQMAPEEALALYRSIVARRMDYAPGVREAFEEVRRRGLLVSLLSNERTARIDALLEHTESRKLFDDVVVSEAVGAEKPDLSIFRIACERLRIEPEGLLMFGDNDIADGACKQLGARYVRVSAFYSKKWYWEAGSTYEPDFIVDAVAPEPVGSLLDSLGL